MYSLAKYLPNLFPKHLTNSLPGWIVLWKVCFFHLLKTIIFHLAFFYNSNHVCMCVKVHVYVYEKHVLLKQGIWDNSPLYFALSKHLGWHYMFVSQQTCLGSEQLSQAAAQPGVLTILWEKTLIAVIESYLPLFPLDCLFIVWNCWTGLQVVLVHLLSLNQEGRVPGSPNCKQYSPKSKESLHRVGWRGNWEKAEEKGLWI